MNKEKQEKLFQAVAIASVCLIIFLPLGVYFGANNSNYAKTTVYTITKTVASITFTTSELCLANIEGIGGLNNAYVNIESCEKYQTKTVTMTANHSQNKTVLIMSINGYIDSYLVSNFKTYFQNNPKLPDYLIIYITSEGGWSNDVELLGNMLLSFEKQGTSVIFVVWQKCTSGCFWLSSYANTVIFGSDAQATNYGFGHDVKNSTIEMKGWRNYNGISAFHFALNGVTSNGGYDYKVSTVQIDANPKLGTA